MADMSDSDASAPSIDDNYVPNYVKQHRAEQQSHNQPTAAASTSGSNNRKRAFDHDANLATNQGVGRPKPLASPHVDGNSPKSKCEAGALTDLTKADSVKSPSSTPANPWPAISRIIGDPIVDQPALDRWTKENAEQSPGLPPSAPKHNTDHIPAVDDLEQAQLDLEEASQIRNRLGQRRQSSNRRKRLFEATLANDQDPDNDSKHIPSLSRRTLTASTIARDRGTRESPLLVLSDDEENKKSSSEDSGSEDSSSEDSSSEDSSSEDSADEEKNHKPLFSNRPRFKWNGDKTTDNESSGESGSGESDSGESGSEDAWNKWLNSETTSLFKKPRKSPIAAKGAPNRDKAQQKELEEQTESEEDDDDDDEDDSSEDTDSTHDGAAREESDDQDDEESETDAANPHWDAIDQRMVVGSHISFEGLCVPWRPHIRRTVLYGESLSDLRHYYTTYRKWGKAPAKKPDVVNAIADKERGILTG